MGVQMFVCLWVCGGLMEIQTSAPIWMNFCTHIPTCPRFWCTGLIPALPGGPETLIAEERVFQNCLQNNPPPWSGYLVSL